MKKPIAIFTSDWHIWGRPPLYRSVEEDWFAAMDRPLRQIRRFQKINGNIPVFIAGDIFDFYNPPPEVINWLIQKMPKNVWAIPGQHDLQNHVYELIEKTGFWTLVKAGAINFLDPKIMNVVETPSMKLNVFSKPWETRVLTPQKDSLNDHRPVIYIAHEYIFKDSSTCYSGANKNANIKNSKELLKDVDVAAFGDNHIPFIGKIGKTKVINCGTLIRRKVDERTYETGFGVLFDNGSLDRVIFDNSKDEFSKIVITKRDEERQDALASELLEELENLDTVSIDFEEQIFRHIEKEKLPKKSKEIMIEIFQQYKEGLK